MTTARFLDRHGDTWEERPGDMLENVRLVGEDHDSVTDAHTRNWCEDRAAVERDFGPLTATES